ncbi:MAG: inositol monophosphatase [Deltaproteobacteria bacterium]|nr:MAG: inositol monophosphatase [Deltaproteobacteria bacterium]RUA00596.1 MAG: inositol monophosphatase [Deltaproteobacteria bacterium]
MDLDQISRVGTTAAYGGGAVLKKYLGRLNNVRKKDTIDIVTEADIESEQIIIDSIRKVYPDHSILAEESGRLNEGKTYQWVIDPLDGTINFAHGLPICAVSIAFVARNQVAVGIVLNPFSGEFFMAIKGRGARLNGRPIRVSNTDHMIDALLATGFPCDRERVLDDLLTQFEAGLKSAQGIRRLGSAALDLCNIACGRFDGFWQQDLEPWDTAAGTLIVTEAGGTVTDDTGHSYHHHLKQILATNGRIHNDMLKMMSNRRTDESFHFSG